MPTRGRRRATRQDDCPTRCGPHPDHGNGLAGEPRLGPSVTLAPVWGVPSSQTASLWRSERNLAMRRGGGRARGGATQEPQQPQGFVPHPSRFVPPSPASQDFWSRANLRDDHRAPLDTSLLCPTKHSRNARWTTRAVWFSAALRRFQPPRCGLFLLRRSHRFTRPTSSPWRYAGAGPAAVAAAPRSA